MLKYGSDKPDLRNPLIINDITEIFLRDDVSFEIKASFDGIIIGKSEIPLVQAGDAIFHIARFGDLETAEHKIGYFSEDAIEQSEFHELNNEESIE